VEPLETDRKVQQVIAERPRHCRGRASGHWGPRRRSEECRRSRRARGWTTSTSAESPNSFTAFNCRMMHWNSQRYPAPSTARVRLRELHATCTIPRFSDCRGQMRVFGEPLPGSNAASCPAGPFRPPTAQTPYTLASGFPRGKNPAAVVYTPDVRRTGANRGSRVNRSRTPS
jgi:hypothetical protein